MSTMMAIVYAAQSRPNEWLNCSGDYIGEVLALTLQGLIEHRVIKGQLQVRARLSA